MYLFWGQYVQLWALMHVLIVLLEVQFEGVGGKYWEALDIGNVRLEAAFGAIYAEIGFLRVSLGDGYLLFCSCSGNKWSTIH